MYMVAEALVISVHLLEEQIKVSQYYLMSILLILAWSLRSFLHYSLCHTLRPSYPD